MSFPYASNCAACSESTYSASLWNYGAVDKGWVEVRQESGQLSSYLHTDGQDVSRQIGRCPRLANAAHTSTIFSKPPFRHLSSYKALRARAATHPIFLLRRHSSRRPPYRISGRSQCPASARRDSEHGVCASLPWSEHATSIPSSNPIRPAHRSKRFEPTYNAALRMAAYECNRRDGRHDKEIRPIYRSPANRATLSR